MSSQQSAVGGVVHDAGACRSAAEHRTTTVRPPRRPLDNDGLLMEACRRDSSELTRRLGRIGINLRNCSACKYLKSL